MDLEVCREGSVPRIGTRFLIDMTTPCRRLTKKMGNVPCRRESSWKNSVQISDFSEVTEVSVVSEVSVSKQLDLPAKEPGKVDPGTLAGYH